MNSKRYFITFIDDGSNYTFLYFLKSKSDVFDTFKLFETEIKKISLIEKLKDFIMLGNSNMIKIFLIML